MAHVNKMYIAYGVLKNLKTPCALSIAVARNHITLTIGDRDFMWNRKTGEMFDKTDYPNKIGGKL